MNNTRNTSASNAPVLLAEDVWKDYDNGAVPVLMGVNFAVNKSETVALCGPSGCGKSTLLHLLGGLDEPDRGVIRVNGTMIDSEDARLPLLRHTIGFVFQLHNLIPDLTLEENCLLPAFAAGLDKQAARERLRELAARCNPGVRRSVAKVGRGLNRAHAAVVFVGGAPGIRRKCSGTVVILVRHP